MGDDASVPPHRQQAVAVIKRGGEHLLSLIEGTLDIAHIEAGKLTLNARPMHFAAVMRELADMFELQAAEKGLAFHFEPIGDLPEVVRADEMRVRQILINLLGNAIKFTSRGHVTLRLRYAREFAALEIEDSGPGMTAVEIERIFEPFARGLSSAGAGGVAPPGAGLGLTIAKMLTDLMGGEMQVQSTPGAGSVFRVRLFLPRVHTALPARGPSTNALPRRRRGYLGARRRVLVVDNEEADRQLLVDVLTPVGFELRTAASGHDALDLIAAGFRPDAMLVDLAMPGIDGWETIRRVRQFDAGLRPRAIAIVSANAFDKRLDNDVGITPEDFFVKPVRHSELLDWLERRLAFQWTDGTATPTCIPSAAPLLVRPTNARLNALAQAVGLGYFRGIMNQLDDIDTAEPACLAWTTAQRVVARKFQFEQIDCLPVGTASGERS